MKKSRIFLIDFDKTITNKDSTDEMLKIYNEKLLKEYQTEFRKGNLNVQKYLTGLMKSLTIDEEEYKENVIKNVSVDEYFEEFINQDIDYRIVSAGTYINILNIFEKYNINIPKELIYSNEVKFTDNGIDVIYSFDKGCGNGITKHFIIEEYKKEYDEVVYIGDGSSDISVVGYADILFAKKGLNLERYCIENNYSYVGFDNFKDLIEYNFEK